MNIWQTHCAVWRIAAGGCGLISTIAEAAWPHHEEIEPGVHAVGFADKFHSANCGWVATAAGTVLIDLPRGENLGDFLPDVAKSTGKPVTTLVLTHATAADAPLVDELRKQGVKRVCLSPATLQALTSPQGPPHPQRKPQHPPRRPLATTCSPIGRPWVTARRRSSSSPVTSYLRPGGASVWLPEQRVLFAGPLVYHGPRVPLVGCDTAAWLAALDPLMGLRCATSFPGLALGVIEIS